MDKNCEVVGWVLIDDSARVLVRKGSSLESQGTLSAEQAFEHVAIRTGSFQRHRIIDSVTREALISETD
jgi:hypothetical protein